MAVSKYEAVVQCLNCAQELLKQIQGISVLWEKEQKKLARKVSLYPFQFGGVLGHAVISCCSASPPLLIDFIHAHLPRRRPPK